MAYNRRNLLKRVVDIQTITLAHTSKGATQEWVYNNKVFPTYKICRATFYNYLAINAKKQLKDIEKAEKAQLNLF